MYCEKCGSLFEGANRECPVCGSRKVRYPRVDDPCFLAEKTSPWGEMLADVLTKRDIPYMKKPLLGAALTISLGQGTERYRFYVPYAQYDEAQALAEQLFPE